MSATRGPSVRVDADRCQGHGRCHALAPELFELDEAGSARVRGEGRVAPSLLARARLASLNCPEHAVVLTEGDRAEGGQ